MKKSKKHLSAISLILIICLLTALFPINALAVDEQSESSTILSDADDYSEIYEESIAIAQSFQSIGITPNDLVTILNLPNKDESFYLNTEETLENPELTTYLDNANSTYSG